MSTQEEYMSDCEIAFEARESEGKNGPVPEMVSKEPTPEAVIETAPETTETTSEPVTQTAPETVIEVVAEPVTEKVPHTCTLTMSTKYVSPQEIIDDAAKNNGCVEYTIETSGPLTVCSVPFNIVALVNMHSAYPTQIATVISGFGKQTPEDRITVLRKYVSEGGDVNGDNGILLLTAASGDNTIFKALFDMGARICDANGQLFSVTQNGVHPSIFSETVTTSTENVLQLLHHLATTDYRHAMPAIIDYNRAFRLDMFCKITEMPETSVEDYIIFILKCVTYQPDLLSNVRRTSQCPEVNAALIIRYGIANSVLPAGLAKCIQIEHFRKARRDAEVQEQREKHDAEVQEKLARLEKIEVILASVSAAE